MNIVSVDDATSFSWKVSLAILLIIAAIFLAMLPEWMRGEEVRGVLDKAGYTDVKLTGFVFLPCGEDLFGMGFEAKGPSGKQASGAVCKGFFKGATVRLVDDKGA